MTKLTFYKGDTDKVGRRDPNTGATTHVPERDCFGDVILNHVNLTKLYFGEKGDFYIIVPPARMQADMQFELLDGNPPAPVEPSDDAPSASESVSAEAAEAPTSVESEDPGNQRRKR